MNACAFTGWLPRPCDVRATRAGDPVLYFQAVVKDADGADELLHFHATDAALIKRCQPMLTNGRIVIIASSKVCRAWHPMSGFGGNTISFRVAELEIPDRSKHTPEPETEENKPEEKVA